jgi:hypothetical protein
MTRTILALWRCYPHHIPSHYPKKDMKRTRETKKKRRKLMRGRI